MNEAKRRRVNAKHSDSPSSQDVHSPVTLRTIDIIKQSIYSHSGGFNPERVSHEYRRRLEHKAVLKRRIMEQMGENITDAIENAVFFSHFVHDRDRYNEIMTCLGKAWSTSLGLQPSVIACIDVRDILGITMEPFIESDEKSKAEQSELGDRLEKIFKTDKQDNIKVCQHCGAFDSMVPLPSLNLRKGDEGLVHFSQCNACGKKTRTSG